MKKVLIVALIFLSSCVTDHRAPKMSVENLQASKNKSPKNDFENQIARSILKEVQEDLPKLKGIDRLKFLRTKSRQFNRGVNDALLSPRMLVEKEILNYLHASEEILVDPDNYSSRLHVLSSLNWDLEIYEKKILEELNRIDELIAAGANRNAQERFDHHAHMAMVRKKASYPEDSFAGRQTYLDRLSQEMIKSQSDWFDTYQNYNSSELSLLGLASSNVFFHYNSKDLSINLEDVKGLPEFELKCLAVFYGFPGLQSFIPRTSQSLRIFLNLPAYTRGWASYILDEIGARVDKNTLDYLYFSRLQASLALVDFKLHTKKWSLNQAIKYLKENTPYSQHRSVLMASSVEKNPGLYLASLGGKIKFSELKKQCGARSKKCQNNFNQQVLDHGPIFFERLENLIL